VSAANVPGLGSVLVDGNGRTLYVLASEKGGQVNCVAGGGCTTIWPPLVVPSGMSQGIAGSGVQASLLGTVKSPAGDVRVTYGGWPLYTFSEDTGSGSAKGQDLTDSFGKWWALSPSGNPVTTAATTPSAPTTAPASGGAGF
jgi:predicted lipoprotein with Yx(FWY)xxD motif